jgi:hypothetical protein
MGEALAYVPEDLKTPEICLAAVQNQREGEALRFVPKALKTPEICLAAVQSWDSGGVFAAGLAFVPKKFRTPELCFAAVQHDGENLRHVPKVWKQGVVKVPRAKWLKLLHPLE